jgi:16S rRNA G966 N2-methylase RsmD
MLTLKDTADEKQPRDEVKSALPRKMARAALDVNVASINQAYGELTARVHDASYTLERAFTGLEKLIEGDDWKSVGGGFDDINEFMASVKLDQFNLIAEQRRAIVRRIKQLQPDVSNRRIAKALGTSNMTIGRDLETYVTGCEKKASRTKETKTNGATSGSLNGFEAAKLVRRRDEHRERIAAAAADRVRRVTGDGTIECRLGDFSEVLADLRDLDAIITDPPYEEDFLPRLRHLAILADRILKPDGVMAVLIGKMYLPRVYALLEGYRPYRWTACYYAPGASTMSFNVNVSSSWKPLIIYGGEKRFHDVFKSNHADAQAGQAMHKWGQDMEAFKSIIEALTEPGDTIVDPFAGGGTTLLAAKSAGRNAIGAEIDSTCEVFKLEQLTSANAERADG